MSLLLPALLVGGVHVLCFVIASRELAVRCRRREMLSNALRLLDDASTNVETQTVVGTLRGLSALVRARGKALVVELFLPPSALLLSVRPRLYPGEIEPGEIPTGDADFDEVFAVEGAPRDVIACLLSPALRRRMLDHREVTVTVEEGTLELHHPALCDPDAVPRLCALAVTIARALPQAEAEADARLLDVAGAPYRADVDASRLRMAQALRQEEVAWMDGARRARDRARARGMVLSLAFCVVLAALLYGTG